MSLDPRLKYLEFLLYTYKWYIFWTLCFLAIWYRKPDQQTEVFWFRLVWSNDMTSSTQRDTVRQIKLLL